jgi:ABC-type lipoprotein export system ATPase subunit
MSLAMKWMADDAERRAFIAEHPESILVSPDMPLRANLSVLDNIALIPQYRTNLGYAAAADQAWSLLLQVGQTGIAFKRDPDLSYEERFAAKLLRAAIGQPSVILVDRPGMLLPDLHYPPHLDALLEKLADSLNACWILDYRWNAPLYPTR